MAAVLYASFAALCMGCAAWLAERALRHQGVATRWVWLASLALSTALVGWGLSPVTPAAPAEAAPTHEQASQQAEPTLPAAIRHVQAQVRQGVAHEARRLEAAAPPSSLPRAGAALSLGLLAALAFNGWALKRRMRGWQHGTLLGTPVRVAPDAGPAVVGLLRPRIVVPQWLLHAPTAQQRIVLAHEQAHLDGRDPQWLAFALLVLVAMPWNLPLWWQVRRLRRAMEVDCDARVLSGGHAPRAYGEVLLAVGQRQSTRLGFAMSAPPSFLEQRITLMLKRHPSSGPGRTAGLLVAGLSLAMAAAAAQLGSPGTAVNLPADVLGALDGDYQTAEQEILHVSHEGPRLFAQSTGRPRVEWKAYSDTELAAINGRQRATVQRDGHGRVNGLVLHLHGTDLAARRIPEAEARRIADGIAARIRQQVASPGTEAAVQRFAAQIQATPARLDGLNALMAAGVREQNEQMRPVFARLGAVKSVEFAGVSQTGYDKYLMQCEHGSVLWDILLDADGTISRVNFTFPSL